MKFGLMFFASSEDALAGDKYRLVLESARFGDRHGFSSVWVPERHFTKFGSLYPNPAVLHAALAMATERIRLNAGSVVAPLHNPLRIAEEWAVVDNLSRGRVGVSFASGWNPDDFAFFPERYAARHDQMYENIRVIERLWRGEAIEVTSGSGKPTKVRIYPTPLQKDLPVWITAAGNPSTYAAAGELGANLLTHMLDQEIEQLAEKVALYRDSRRRAGFDPTAGEVTLMLHTFVGEDAALVREQARLPFCEYIKSNISLLGGLAQSRGRSVDVTQLPQSDLDEFVNYLYERFASTRGLIGTPESSIDLVRQLENIGVDEIACLLDFGPDKELILSYLPHLNRLKQLYTSQPDKRPRAAVSLFSPEAIKLRCGEQMSGAEFHSLIEEHGVYIDNSIRFVERVWRRDGEALAELRPPRDTGNGYLIHPAYLDACGRVLAAAVPRALFEEPAAGLYVPAGMKSFRLHRAAKGAALSNTVLSHAVLRSREGDARGELSGDVSVYDAAGELLLEIEGLQLKTAPARAEEYEAGREHLYDRLLYRREWKPVGLTAMRPRDDERGGWLIFADRNGVGEKLAWMLEQRNHTCHLAYESLAAEEISRLILDCLRHQPPLRGVVHLWSLDAPPSETLTVEALSASQERAVKSALHLIQSLAAHANQERIPTYFVTRGALAVLPETDSPAVAQSPLWGLAQAVAVEHPNLWGGLIDLDPADSSTDSPVDSPANSMPASIEALLDAISQDRNQDDSESMLAVRAGRHYAPRLKRETLPAGQTPLQFSEEAAYLITGGTGGLGRRLALWMAERGARHLWLMSRTASEDNARKLLDELRGRGAEALVVSADVASEQDVARALDQVRESGLELRGVFHLAGRLDDARLVNETWARLAQVPAAKLEGAWNLHRLMRDARLDFFVMFSSAASLLTMAGQANYAMANTFLDALAHHRRALGLHALSINWGPWAGAGHAETDYGREAHAKLDFLGIRQLPPRDGFEALRLLLERDSTQAAVISVDWNRLFENDAPVSRLPMLSEIVERHRPTAALIEGNGAEIAETLRAMPESEHRDFLMDFLSDRITETLKLDTGFRIEPRRKLFELGFDSILAIELKNRLERSFQRPFSATLLFMYPTLESLTDHLLKEAIGLKGDEECRARAVRDDEPQDVDALSEEQMVELLLREVDAGRR
jgi:natural product biosynthesis luciferase-like monooxygenase protein